MANRTAAWRVHRVLVTAGAFAASATLLAACATASSSSTTSGPRLRVLTPAAVSPRVRECSQRLTLTADGNAAPLRCRAGGLNVRAWRFYSMLGTDVMSLGRRVTWPAVKRAMCSDEQIDHATTPEEQNAAQLASDYYGWDLTVRIRTFTNDC